MKSTAKLATKTASTSKPLLSLRNSAARAAIMSKGGVHERPRSGERQLAKRQLRRQVKAALNGD